MRAGAGLIRRIWKPEQRRCAQCWRPVFLVEDADGTASLTCANRCEPGGHVSEFHVEHSRMADQRNALEAAHHYPELAMADSHGYLLATRERTAREADALWGPGAGDPIREAQPAARTDRLPEEYLRQVSAYWSAERKEA